MFAVRRKRRRELGTRGFCPFNQALRFSCGVRAGPEDALRRAEDDVPSIRAPDRIGVDVLAVRQPGLAPAAPIVDPEIGARSLSLLPKQPAAVRRGSGKLV